MTTWLYLRLEDQVFWQHCGLCTRVNAQLSGESLAASHSTIVKCSFEA